MTRTQLINYINSTTAVYGYGWENLNGPPTAMVMALTAAAEKAQLADAESNLRLVIQQYRQNGQCGYMENAQ